MAPRSPDSQVSNIFPTANPIYFLDTIEAVFLAIEQL